MHYDEMKPNTESSYKIGAGPTVVRDCPNVHTIAENTSDFACIVRARYLDQRDADWRKEE